MRTKPMIRTRYYAEMDVCVNGTSYKAGDEILNARPGNLESMARRGQVRSHDFEEAKPVTPPKAETKAEKIEDVKRTVPAGQKANKPKPQTPSEMEK